MSGRAPRRTILALAALFLSAVPLFAARVRPLNLEEMARRADRILSGRCVGVRVARDPALGRLVTHVTFAVDRSVKGGARGSLTITILGDQGSTPAPGAALEGLPRFAQGEEVVLFLYPDSARGLTSPVGFGQGKFLVMKDKQGRSLAVNALGNRNLLRGLSPEAERRLGDLARTWRGRAGIPPGALLDMALALSEE